MLYSVSYKAEINGQYYLDTVAPGDKRGTELTNSWTGGTT